MSIVFVYSCVELEHNGELFWPGEFGCRKDRIIWFERNGCSRWFTGFADFFQSTCWFPAVFEALFVFDTVTNDDHF